MDSVIITATFGRNRPLSWWLNYCYSAKLKDHKNEYTVHQNIIMSMLNCAMDEQVRAT